MATLARAVLESLTVQNGVTGNIIADGSANTIYPGAALSWDAAGDAAIKNAAGANLFAGIAIGKSELDGDKIEIYRRGIVKILVASIGGTVDIGVPLYLNDTDNIRDDLFDTAALHTFFGNVVGIEGVYALIEFDVARTRP